MKRQTILVIIIMTFSFVLIASQDVEGDIYFNDGDTHSIDSAVSENVWVNNSATGIGTTVNMNAGSRLTAPYELQTFEDSRINFYDGSSMEHEAWLYAHNDSQINVYGGALSYLYTYGNSEMYISGGSITGNIETFNDSQVYLSDGSVLHFFAYDNSQSYITGGLITYNRFFNDSQVDIFGGSIVNELVTEENAVMTIHGSNFAIDGQPFGYGELTNLLGGLFGNEPSRRLTGRLASGELLDNDFYIGGNSKIVLTPIPSAVILGSLGLTFSGWLLKRKRMI